MARLSREFVKLETRLLNDYRFFEMSERGQLTYIKLLVLGRSSNNKITKRLPTLKALLRVNWSEDDISLVIKEIKSNFPNFKSNKYFHYFFGYEERFLGRKLKTPIGANNSCVDEDVDLDVDKDVEEDKDLTKATPVLHTALDKIYKQGFNIYSLINKAKKLMGQPAEWKFPEEVLLRICEAYERDKANVIQSWPWFIKVLKAESGLWHASQQVSKNVKDKGFAPSIKEILNLK